MEQVKIKAWPQSIDPEQKFFVLTIMTGFLAGGIAILLKVSVHELMHLFGTDRAFTWVSFLIGGLSLTIGGYISTKLFPACSGSGIPRTKIIIAVHHGVIKSKEWLIKLLTTILSLSSGVPLGYEGPTIAITAGVGSSLGRRSGFKERRIKELMYVGSAAGIAAAFGTPIAAVLFVMEEMIGSMKTKSMGPILISSLIASVTASALIGQNSMFTPLSYSMNSPVELLFYLALGLMTGIIGPFFVDNILAVKKLTKKFFKHHQMMPILFSFLIVGLASLATTEVLGNGLETVNKILQGEIAGLQLIVTLIVLKFITCAFCYGAGISGGILMPVLFLGAGIGALFGYLANHTLGISEIQLGAYALVGMGAFFASVIRTPFTSVILVFEMTRDYRIILPLMLGNLVAYFVSKRINHGSIYEVMSRYEGIELPSHDEEDTLMNITVEHVYTQIDTRLQSPLNYSELIYLDQSLSYAIVKLKRLGGQKSLVVVDRLDPLHQHGTLSLSQIFDYLQSQNLAD